VVVVGRKEADEDVSSKGSKQRSRVRCELKYAREWQTRVSNVACVYTRPDEMAEDNEVEGLQVRKFASRQITAYIMT
jgi:hypothetical protein